MEANDLKVIKWLIDMFFVFVDDLKSHTSAVMTMGKGSVQALSKKQKLNTRSSTESKLVGVDDISTMILCTKPFLEH